MKISASIYSQREKPLFEIIPLLYEHKVDMLHIDCKDTPSTFDDIATIRQLTATPIDLHIIASDPSKYFKAIEELKVEFVSLQYEEMQGLIELPHIAGTQFGIAIQTATSIDVLAQAKGYSYVMLMCTTPGMSGGSFQRENFQRIIDIRHRYPQLQIQVDGGVNDEVAYILRLLGVHSAVSGSYLMNHYSIGSGMLSLHREPTKGDFLVSDFMTPTKYLPILNERELSFDRVLRTIEEYKQGFVLIINDEKQMKGVISNADVRRGLIEQLPDLEAIDVVSMLNTKPIHISAVSTLEQMLKIINALPFIILFLPVVNQHGELEGAVLLNNLTRG